MNDKPLYWESSLEIIQALNEAYPEIDIERIGLRQLNDMIITLPNFKDDPALVNDSILNDILREWYEENSA